MVEVEVDNQINGMYLGDKDLKDPFRILHLTTIHDDEIRIWLSPKDIKTLKDILKT